MVGLGRDTKLESKVTHKMCKLSMDASIHGKAYNEWELYTPGGGQRLPLGERESQVLCRCLCVFRTFLFKYFYLFF